MMIKKKFTSLGAETLVPTL